MKKTFCLIALLLNSMVFFANPVSKERAEQVARNAVARLCAERQGITSTQSVVLTDISTTLGCDHIYFYTYRYSEVEGFIIVSGDDNADPVLAFSDESAPDLSDIETYPSEGFNPAFRQQLHRYNYQIAQCRQTPTKVPDHVILKWKSLESNEPVAPTKGEFFNDNIPPLFGNMRWNQTTPYNNMCPGGSVTGCVATAYGMIMRYWGYPEHGFGTHSYNGADNPAAYPSWTYGRLSADFEHTYYDWAHMEDYLGIYSSDTAITAVATLLYHIGVSLDMRYTPNGSGCWSLREYAIFDTSLHISPTVGSEYRIPKHFGYRYDYAGMRDSIGDDTLWLHMLYNSLVAGKPIYYAGWAADTFEVGHSGTSGHGYVIDGYFSDELDSNYFHINWGWGGQFDGFFKLDAMTPNGSDFTQWHGAVIGLEPDTSYHGYDPAAIRHTIGQSPAQVSSANGHITVTGAEGRSIAVYDIMGRHITGCTHAKGSWQTSVRPGIYIVRIDPQAHKTIVLK